jgi:hypothetical protein
MERISFSVETEAIGEGGQAIRVEDTNIVVDYPKFLDLAGTAAEGSPYPVNVVAELGDKKIVTATELIVKNPCIDPELFSIVVTTDVPNFTYTLYNTTKTEWYHDAFPVQASDSVKALCGGKSVGGKSGIKYSVEAGALTEFITYDATEHTFSIYLEDRSLLAEPTIEYTLKAELADQPAFTPVTSTGTITLVDPCEKPFYLIVEEMSEEVTHYGITETIEFPVTHISPAVCLEEAAVYSCRYDGGPYTGGRNPCSLVDGETENAFDAATGTMTFSTEDLEHFPAGEYKFTNTITVGDKKQDVPFTITIKDPCPTTSVRILRNPFIGKAPYTYVLFEPALEVEFDLA